MTFAEWLLCCYAEKIETHILQSKFKYIKFTNEIFEAQSILTKSK